MSTLKNVHPAEDLRGLAARKAKPKEYRSVRNALVDEECISGWEVANKPGKVTTRLSRQKDHDMALEDRVWILLYRMDFSFLSGQGGAFQLIKQDDEEAPGNQIDVVAIDEEVAFAIECKSSLKSRKFDDFTGVLAKHASVKENFTRAVRDQFPSQHKRPTIFALWTVGYILTDNDRARADKERIPLLEEADLLYYESLVVQIGAAARYQFLADILQGRSVPGLEITLPAIRTKWGPNIAYTFSVSPEYLLKIAFVSHRARGKASDIDAYQRMLKRGRIRSIKQYIMDGGIFPTNIVINIKESKWVQFDRSKQETDDSPSTFGWLHIRPAYRVAWIIDGQHRLFAYAGHPLAKKSVVSVVAFVGLPPSEQARMFVDINAEQRKVKQSLLQELYAELHWDAEDPETRVQAILSKVIQALDTEAGAPFNGRILKADDARTELRCISLTSVFRAMERTGFFIAKTKKGSVIEYGPLWDVENLSTLRRTVQVLSGYFDVIRSEATHLWDLGSGEGGGLAMNDGVTVCINVLRSILNHLQECGVPLTKLSDDELVKEISPFASYVGKYFSSMSPDRLAQFRALRGIQGQTAGTRRVEEAIRQADSTFDPPGLNEYLEREKTQTTSQAFQVIHHIEQILQKTVLNELKDEFGPEDKEWWFNGVPLNVRKRIDERINEEGGKKGGREENFDLINYRDVVIDHWTLFESILARGKGNKNARTNWIAEVNEVRKIVMHASKGISLPITEEQLTFLKEIESWLEGQASSPTAGE